MNTSALGAFSLANIDLQNLAYYPEVEIFKKAILSSSDRDRKSLVRLWLTEGIPYAFKNNAGTYDEMREWLAIKLNIHAKDVTLVGSGRIGFSMKPNVFGRSFGGASDLDLTIINKELFEACKSDAQKFSNDIISKKISPKSEFQKTNWEDTIKRLPTLIKRGFIDTNQILGNENYASILKINNTMWQLSVKLKNTPEIMTPKKVTARIYSDWDSLVTRVSFNLDSARKDFNK
ncbi:hypothetical protein [Janthinobacterium sp.]|uniref:hypothetical protein n=1 Tax=Janthinobacterium sp. TaxID=1871054 RepID=UPI002611BE07|nr:hypothetical protein [Janthinobacterium sp.]